jgi:hypothetical protein
LLAKASECPEMVLRFDQLSAAAEAPFRLGKKIG